MGSLHEGHLALVKKCRQHNDIVVSSIYVNPAQFNDESDLTSYPRSLSNDLDFLKNSGCDVVFAPKDEEMYSEIPKVILDFGELGKVMEGKFRPGHFNGVGLVVSKLLNIIQPDRAYFGEKDIQQLLVIRQLVRDLNFGTEIVGVSTIREKSGLAMSSRNERLDTDQRQQAELIFKVLNKCKDAIINGSDIVGAKEVAKVLYAKNQGVKPEYVEFVDLEKFEVLKDLDSTRILSICTAAYIGDIRLIDNIIFEIGK
jgi:pantoate--beta-alanine ligase